MAQHYSIKDFFRQMPNALLAGPEFPSVQEELNKSSKGVKS